MDYFNDKERSKQAAFSARRDQFFKPFVSGLVSLGITPTQVSIVGVAFAFAAGFFPPAWWLGSAACMVLYVLMDGIDGPLARHTNRQSQGGSLVDIFADQIGVVIIAVAAVYWLDARVYIQIPFSVFYVFAIFSMVICNAFDLKFNNILRVKYFYFVGYIASMVMGTNMYLDIFAAIFLVYYVFYFLKMFSKVVMFLDKP